MNRVATFVIMGDSAAAGTGDADRNGALRGWGYYLAQHFNQPLVYANLSRPGAQSGEVFIDQLPKALVLEPTLTAVIVGGNDALRNGFSPDVLRQNLRQTLKQLREVGSEILLLQLHEPTSIAPLPKTLGKVLNRRINFVNAVTRAVGAEFGAHILAVRDIPGVYDRNRWHVDRMHPSKFGHQILAQNFREILAPRWDISPVALDPVTNRAKKDSILWMLRHATPWFLKRSVDLLPAALILVMGEYIRMLTRRDKPAQGILYFPEFVNNREAALPQIQEARVS
ncbi:MAG: SGNH/GDSL hydrolase family protein [Candidatus Planktophila sp.]|jgi:lysophospholipase L1-like esterase|nr:SGNH/GDSL hydrolase family protein [Candidatus Planktophila sp.]